MTKQFIPMTNLNDLNEEQKQQYYIDACEHFNIPHNLNLLGFFWLDSGDGARNLVLYAKKGATDVIRDRLQINTISLTSEQIGDALVYTVTGRNEKNRTEIAVGAADIKGKVGKTLTDAIMTAQTRATRRMTLQFIGGGLLDESEVQTSTTNLNTVSTSLSELAKAVAPVPHATPPKDITPDKSIQTAVFPTPEQLEAQKILAEMDRARLAVAAGEAPDTPQISPEAPVVKKRRKKSNEVSFDLGAPEPVKLANADIPESQHSVTQNSPTQGVSLQEISIDASSMAAVVKKDNADIQAYISSAKPIPLPGAPSSEQLKEYRKRLTKYTDEILPKAGLVPTEGIGGPTVKTRLYTMQRFKVLDIRHLTIDNWAEFFQFLDNSTPEIVVNEIDKAVGA